MTEQPTQPTPAEQEYDAELARRPELLRYAARLHHEPDVVTLRLGDLMDGELEELVQAVERLHYLLPVTNRRLWQLTRRLVADLRLQQAARDIAWRNLTRSAGMPATCDDEEGSSEPT
jgi:hypothetical protein